MLKRCCNRAFTFIGLMLTIPVAVVSAAADPAPLISDISFSPSSVRSGSSFTARVAGTGMDENTYLDLRFRAPGNTIDEVVLNWQQGAMAGHNLPRNTRLGVWTVTGARAHQDRDDHSGSFDPAAADLTVLRAPVVSGVSFDPPIVVAGRDSIAQLAGADLTNSTYVDIRDRKSVV